MAEIKLTEGQGVKKIAVCGAGGFIGSHLAKRLKAEGHWVRAVDWKDNEYMDVPSFCDEFVKVDLRNLENCRLAVAGVDWCFNLAADMGGMGFIQSNHSRILYNSTMISFNVAEAAREAGVKRFWFASSACIYPEFKQLKEEQTRSFCFVDDAVEGIIRLMCSDYAKPLNIGSDEMVSMNEMAAMALALEDKKIPVKHIPGPEGVRGRNSDNTLIKQVLGWAPSITLKDGLARTFVWIKEEIENEKAAGGSTDDYVSSTVMTQTMTKECDMARK
ncbi:hypothetical protein T492DRAFT_933570 [Pavlovales sp. CCMP2436]|nr:hypothetical protein T492DRAFT_933570 [Pavlovales sp. CCMP2436]